MYHRNKISGDQIPATEYNRPTEANIDNAIGQPYVNGFRALLALEEPKYTIEQIAARTGKSAVFVCARLRLTELTPVIVEAFYREEIGVGHALLLAKLQPA